MWKEPYEGTHKIYDFPLFLKLGKFAKPYLHLIFLAFIALMLSSAFDISSPYIVKTAIDRYITPRWGFVKIEALKKLSLPENSIFKISSDSVLVDLSKLSRPKRLELEKLGLVKKEKVFVFKEVPGELLQKYPELFVKKAGIYILPYSRLSRMAREDALKLRIEDKKGLFFMALLLISVLLGGFISGFALAYILQYTGQKIMHDLRMAVMEHLTKLPVKYFDKNPVGRLVTRATNDISAINEMYTSVLVYLIKDILLFAGILLIMFKMSKQLTLWILIFVPFVLVAGYLFRMYARNAYRLVRKNIAKVNAFVQENLEGIFIVQVFNAQRRAFKRFLKISKDLYDAEIKQLYVFAIFRPVIELFSALAIALIIWVGGKEILQGTLTFGALMAFITYVEMLFQPIKDLAEKYNIFQAAMAAAERIFGLLGENPEETGQIRLPEIKGEIEFRDVWFAYNDEEWVLKGISFKIKPGEKVALVGPTGAGKTSIVSLILGFYRPQKGKILIDGIDMKELSIEFIRRNIAIVFQDVFLFTGNFRDNITLREDLSEDNIKKALQVTKLDELLKRKGYNLESSIGEGGKSLSIGERQLLSFARALSRDVKIVLLDEATSSVDSYTEQLIEKSLKELLKDKTAIIIAHRLSTVHYVDRIFVVLGGKIVEEGTHEELLKKQGIYSRLYTIQFGYVDHVAQKE